MFKTNQPSEMNYNKCGVGSIMKMGNCKYLICASTKNSVYIIDLHTFIDVSGSNIDVSDINFLTEDEVRKLGYSLQCTLSDFEFDNKGFKP